MPKAEYDVDRLAHGMERLLHRLAIIEKNRDYEHIEPLEQQTLIDDLRSARREARTLRKRLLESEAGQRSVRKHRVLEERRFHDFFEFVPDGCLVTNIDGVILESSRNAADLLNTSSSFLRNRPLFMFVGEEWRRVFLQQLERLKEVLSSHVWQLRLQPRGEMPPVDTETTVIPLLDHNDETYALCWILRDVTKRMRAEAELRREKERAQEYLEVAGAIIVSIGKDERIRMINREGCELLGYEHHEIVGKNWFELCVPESGRSEFREGFRRFTEAGERTSTWKHENNIVTKGGQEIVVDWRSILLSDEAGQATGVLCSGIDVTERKSIEEQFRQEKEFNEHLINSSGDGIIAFDMDFRCTKWNPAMEHISGVAKEETLGANIFEKFPFLRQEQVRYQVFLDTVSGKTLSFKECAYIIPRTGFLRYFDSEFSPLRDEKGSIIGGLIIIRDVTERKLSEEAVRKSEARYRLLSQNLEKMVREKVSELQQAESLAAIGRVVSVVAHEIRNPLQNIHMGIDTLCALFQGEKGIEGSEKGEVINEIRYGLSQLNKIVDDLLEYAKPIKLHRAPWRFRDLLSRALSMISDRLQNINVVQKLGHSDRPISGDADKILRLLLNLLTNATEAMPEGGRLFVRSDLVQMEDEEKFLFSIGDTGQGMSEEQLARIQEPFYTTKKRGTGLGLSICRQIVDAHGGEMRFRSKLHEGTTVEVILPLRRKEANERRAG